ncbi:uncharacterized protein LOC125178215 [Hyalella azteca]|uniref:Uncharacterized protein LOC125178215 n=1 Tax=Hyalella azteca TaxID=294128 RepID=A0A979FL33_HYAAZ|nr:uncharacterized protein LOC125178215 [Hyalella azteca]
MPEVSADAESRVRGLCRTISDHLCDGRRGEILRSGVRLCIVGRPNVGKSSLLNVLLQRPAAIVSPIPGSCLGIHPLEEYLSGPEVILPCGDVVERDTQNEDNHNRICGDVVERDTLNEDNLNMICDDVVERDTLNEDNHNRICGDAIERDTQNEDNHDRICGDVVESDTQNEDNHDRICDDAIERDYRKVNKSNVMKCAKENKLVVNEGDKLDGVGDDLRKHDPDCKLNVDIKRQESWKSLSSTVTELLAELFQENLRLMRWFQENNYVVLLNKTDLLEPQDKAYLLNYLSCYISYGKCDKTSSTCLHHTLGVNSTRSSFSGASKDSTRNGNELLPCILRCDAEVKKNISVDKSAINVRDNSQCFLCVPSSLLHEEGVESLLSSLACLCERLCWNRQENEAPAITSARHRAHLSAALKSLLLLLGEQRLHRQLCGDTSQNLSSRNGVKNSDLLLKCNNDNMSSSNESAVNYLPSNSSNVNLLAHESTLDVAAHHLFVAARHLGQITGHISTEQVLDQIFSEFCIGK